MSDTCFGPSVKGGPTLPAFADSLNGEITPDNPRLGKFAARFEIVREAYVQKFRAALRLSSYFSEVPSLAGLEIRIVEEFNNNAAFLYSLLSQRPDK